jgi:hypothetical protein
VSIQISGIMGPEEIKDLVQTEVARTITEALAKERARVASLVDTWYISEDVPYLPGFRSLVEAIREGWETL